MSLQSRVERTLLPQTCSLTTPGHARGDPHPHQCQRLRGESKATQAMAEMGESSLGAGTLVLPRLPEVEGAPRDPVNYGHTPQIRMYGGRGPIATEVGQEVAPPPTEGLGAASTSVATDGFQGGETHCPGGEKALETCGTWKSGSEVMAGAKAKDAETGKCAAIFSVVVAEEERAEVVVEKPAGCDDAPSPAWDILLLKKGGDEAVNAISAARILAALFDGD
ncbi:PREDICTED: testis-specific Y-encoded-like protein 6 [Galeopterus variegatus]|uniref:Testis-specific Y-encoded-like protein 6 n=1 Tax=Galeopterus variegatus TaxID=482537 RepID=A0ABM0Q7Y7_GALVR|nr:PREDICTED: testis-specific Y-encoded-like protein 6 [Galeopterus variegatus]